MLLEMARALRAAADEENWTRLAAAERQLRRQLPAMVAQKPWSQAERETLLALRQVHAAALQRCTEAKERLGQHLGEMQENKEGMLAYALHSATIGMDIEHDNQL